MHPSAALLLSAVAVAVLAAPAYPALSSSAATPDALDTASAYFSLLADKVQQSRSALPACDLTAAQLPSSSVSPSLPPPSDGLVLKHVAIGRGTQNYTCSSANSTAAPAAVGAVATLFNASCIAAAYPDLLNLLPAVVLPFNLTDDDVTAFSDRLYPSNLDVSGHHFFTTASTPFFNLDAPSQPLGHAACSKNNTQAAPSDSITTSTVAATTTSSSAVSNRGQHGEPAVPWLKLLAHDSSTTTGNLREVYRVQTAGGSSPATCAGMPAAFQVQYAAQYWFYESA
ncbi:conserved fungal protein [Grosmannia clavigera kw1407]|uniref:Conserved fungal protein n=1 Tax=Grosmannia clavigera (strain kw1407 / UAMH 11150) TaxID=655863 RepID=F0XLT0_GROCL|nr:uncharacterized protein CMQ_6366 [Grosmannia clavigera kw1407]EFX01424.1 conserved fungal protein [Grosmannia clavigera kw1407]